MERTDKLLAMLPQGTAALLHNASNIFYLSAYTDEGLLLVASGIRAVITDFRYVEAAQKQCPGFTVHSIRAGVSHVQVAAQLLREAGITRLAIEDNIITVRQRKDIEAAMPGVTFEPLDFKVEALREVIAGTGMWAGGVYFALQMMTVIIAPIPSNISMMAGALALGFWPAMILGVLAVIAGSVIVFLAARALGRNAVQRFLDKGVMEKYLPIIEEKQDMFLFLTMLFPFFPDDALCMLAGLTKIPLGRFVAIMALARPWGLVVAALLGSGSLSLPVWAWAVIGGAGLLIFVFAMKYSAQIEEALLGLVRRIVPKRNRSDRN